MRPSSFHRRPTLPLALALTMLLALLALPARATAQARLPIRAHSASATHAHKTSCPTARSKQGARACVHGGKSHHASKRHHATPVKKTGAAPALASRVPASCEDGSAPLRARDGSFSCADGSEPACQYASAPTPSSNGLTLLCPAAPKPGQATGCEAPSSTECTFGGSSSGAVCEDATSPLAASDGSVVCDDGSEPACEDGSSPAFSEDGSTAICETAPVGDSSD